jgi:hypothetical protein
MAAYVFFSFYLNSHRWFLLSLVYKRAIWKLNSSELLSKQAMRKKIVLYTKNMYVLKQLLNIVTAGIEAPVILGNKFLYACVKEVYRL